MGESCGKIIFEKNYWNTASLIVSRSEASSHTDQTTTLFFTAGFRAPKSSSTVLAARAGISSGTLTWHLGRLQKNDLITISRAGRGMRIFPQDHT